MDNKVSKKTSHREKKKRRLLILIILLFFCTILLSSVTYAWFTSNKNATIDNIDINVATLTGMQVSADAINWSNELTKDQLINAYKTYPRAENQLPDTLSGVSTAGAVSGGKMNMFYGYTAERGKAYYLKSQKETEINCVGDEQCSGHHFIAFDMFLLTTNEANLVVTSNSSVVNRGEVDDGGQNAARVGFVVLGSVAENAGASAQSLMSGQNAVIWEPNYDVHTQMGVEAARNVYGINTTTSGATRISYYGINQEITNMVDITQTNSSPYFSLVNPQIATTKNFIDDQVLTSIPAGITKIRVYMWLEGQDVDLENNAADGQLTFNLEVAMTN